MISSVKAPELIQLLIFNFTSVKIKSIVDIDVVVTRVSCEMNLQYPLVGDTIASNIGHIIKVQI